LLPVDSPGIPSNSEYSGGRRLPRAARDGSGDRIFRGSRSPWRASGVNTGGCLFLRSSQSTHNIGRSSRELFFMRQSWDLRPAGTVGGARLLFMVSTGFLLWLAWGQIGAVQAQDPSKKGEPAAAKTDEVAAPAEAA